MVQDNYYILERLVVNLNYAWKDYFGLGTQYVGYLNPNQIMVLLILKREELSNKSLILEELLLDDLNAEAVKRGFEPFSYNNEIEKVLPKLYKVFNDVDFPSVDDKAWEDIFDYLRKVEKKYK